MVLYCLNSKFQARQATNLGSFSSSQLLLHSTQNFVIISLEKKIFFMQPAQLAGLDLDLSRSQVPALNGTFPPRCDIFERRDISGRIVYIKTLAPKVKRRVTRK